MKKLYALFAGICISGASLDAQTYTISPNDTVYGVAPFYNLTIFDIFQDNISSNPLTLQWTLVSSNLVAGWDFSLCDLGHCYTGFPASGTMDPVPVSGQGFLGVNIDPANIPGTGTVRFYVYDANFPNSGDTLTWIISTPPAGVENAEAFTHFDLYPNPVSDQLFIREMSFNTEPAVITILDMTGRPVAAGVQDQSGLYVVGVASLPAGCYLVDYRTAGGAVGQKRFIKTQR